MRAFRHETDLARNVVRWLQDCRWDVYQEVQPGAGWPIADIVAVNGSLIWVIESKLSVSLDVIDQAMKWSSWAHYVSIAAPMGRARRSEACYRFLGSMAIGLIQVNEHGTVEETLCPCIKRSARTDYLKKCLRPEHQTYAEAGNANGKRWTPFRQTSDNALRIVQQKPGITLKELVDAIETHYRRKTTARACLSKWIRRGVIKGIEMRREGRKLRIYPGNK